jgi:hypothetical protein
LTGDVGRGCGDASRALLFACDQRKNDYPDLSKIQVRSGNLGIACL